VTAGRGHRRTDHQRIRTERGKATPEAILAGDICHAVAAEIDNNALAAALDDKGEFDLGISVFEDFIRVQVPALLPDPLAGSKIQKRPSGPQEGNWPQIVSGASVTGGS